MKVRITFGMAKLFSVVSCFAGKDHELQVKLLRYETLNICYILLDGDSCPNIYLTQNLEREICSLHKFRLTLESGYVY